MEVKRDGPATLKDVARLAGVHPATVSRALDPARSELVRADTRARVLQVAEEVGYRVNTFAQSLRKNVSGMMGIVVADVANPFLPPLLRGIEQVLREHDNLLLITETHDDSGTLRQILDQLINRRVDAIILCAAHQADHELVSKAAAVVPVVLAVRTVGMGSFPSITHDDFLGAQLATSHLVDLGHRTIAQLQGPTDVSSFSSRTAGFASVLARSTSRDVSTDDHAASPTVEEGRRLAGLVLDQTPPDRPTAIFAHNDQMAVGALEALAERGLRCPVDVSLVGYNDAPLVEHLSPPLTTVRLPSLELGRRAASLALALISGDESDGPAQEKSLPPELIIRESTAPPPQSNGAGANAQSLTDALPISGPKG